MAAAKIPPVPGDVLFWTGTSLLDSLVRLGTLSTFDHVGVVQPGNLTFEALPGGVQASPLATRGPYYLLSRNQPGWPAPLAAFVKATVGEEYSYLNDLMAAVGAGPVTSQEWQCAQLTIHVLKMLGEPVPPNLDITPQAVLEWLMNRGYVLQYQASWGDP